MAQGATSAGDRPALKSQGMYVEGAEALWPFCSGCPNSSAPAPACLKASALSSLPGYQATLRGSRSRRSLHTALHDQRGIQHCLSSQSCSCRDTAPQVLVLTINAAQTKAALHKFPSRCVLGCRERLGASEG